MQQQQKKENFFSKFTYTDIFISLAFFCCILYVLLSVYVEKLNGKDEKMVVDKYHKLQWLFLACN